MHSRPRCLPSSTKHWTELGNSPSREGVAGRGLISRIENWDIRRSYCGDSISPKTTPVFPLTERDVSHRGGPVEGMARTAISGARS